MEHLNGAGVEGVTFHTMRHSWASWQVQAGTSARVLMDMGGWASMQMPNEYTHLDPGHLLWSGHRHVSVRAQRPRTGLR
jgi:integrase